MSSLGQKLRQLDLEFLHGVPVHLNDEMIEQIEQAFIYDGWKKHDKFGCIQFDLGEEQKANLMARIIEEMMLHHESVMTKQEWECQAVKDGWVGPKDEKMQLMDSLPMNILTPPSRLMTGQEWLSRFFREMRKDSSLIKEDFNGLEENVIAAAKKAAGIE